MRTQATLKKVSAGNVALGAAVGLAAGGLVGGVASRLPRSPAPAAGGGRTAALRQQVEAVRGVGLDKAGRRAFLEGKPVVTEVPSPGGDPTIITLQLGENRLTAGIFRSTMKLVVGSEPSPTSGDEPEALRVSSAWAS